MVAIRNRHSGQKRGKPNIWATNESSEAAARLLMNIIESSIQQQVFERPTVPQQNSLQKEQSDERERAREGNDDRSFERHTTPYSVAAVV